jgi:hypothetical protein
MRSTSRASGCSEHRERSCAWGDRSGESRIEKCSRSSRQRDTRSTCTLGCLTREWRVDGAFRYSTPRVLRSPGSREAFPYDIRVFLEEFRLRITKAGATEEEVDRAMQLLRSPSLFTWYSVGTPRALPEDKVLQGMRAVAENVIIPELRTRGRDV